MIPIRGGRRVNPETLLTRQIREVLRLLRVPTTKHWGGPLSEKGVPDLIGVLPPAGRALFIEVKVGRGALRPEQDQYLTVRRAAGAVAFAAWSVRDVLRELTAAGYEPAKGLSVQLGGGPGA